MPLKTDPKGGGSNAGGTRSTMYCSHCYQEGKFTLPNITVGQTQERVKAKLKEFGFPGFLAGRLTKKIFRSWRGGERRSLSTTHLAGASYFIHLNPGGVSPPPSSPSAATRIREQILYTLWGFQNTDARNPCLRAFQFVYLPIPGNSNTPNPLTS